MKKYIAPEVEIKRFAVENIMTGSEAAPEAGVGLVDGTTTADVSAEAVNYTDLFGIN